MSPRNPKMHKTYFRIAPVNYEKTIYDADLMEPIQETRKDSEFVIGGQINSIGYYAYGSSSRPTRAGEKQSESAYIVFSARDCNKEDWVPAPGDVIKQMFLASRDGKETSATKTVHLELTTIQPAMFYKGQPRAYFAYYSDISPAEKARGVR